MTKTLWLILLGAVLAGGVVLIAVLGSGGERIAGRGAAELLLERRRARVVRQSLTGLSPTTASKSDYQSAVDAIQSDWDAVKSDASDLKDVTTSQLSSAWDSYESAVAGGAGRRVGERCARRHQVRHADARVVGLVDTQRSRLLVGRTTLA